MPERIYMEILQTFHEPFKARRFLEVVEGHGHTGHLDRLEGSGFPKSYRLQLAHDYRATACCLPRLATVLIVHTFAKSADPNYRRAVGEHDGRLEGYFFAFKEFVDAAEDRQTRWPGRRR